MSSETHADTKEKLTVGKVIGKGIDWFEVGTLSIGVAALAILLISNVIARSFFQSIYFADEVTKFLIILISFVGVSYAARKARHIRMGAFLDLMPWLMEKIFIFMIASINAFVMGFMAYHSFDYMMTVMQAGQQTSALQVPYWIFLVIIPIGFASASIQYIRTVIKNIQEKEVWISPEQQSEYEDEAPTGY